MEDWLSWVQWLTSAFSVTQGAEIEMIMVTGQWGKKLVRPISTNTVGVVFMPVIPATWEA
jgi:hypothetical protein